MCKDGTLEAAYVACGTLVGPVPEVMESGDLGT